MVPRRRGVTRINRGAGACQEKTSFPEFASFVALPTLLLALVTALVLAAPLGRLVLLPLHGALLRLLRQVLGRGFLRGRSCLRGSVLARCLGRLWRTLAGRLLRLRRRTLNCGLLHGSPDLGRPVLPLRPRWRLLTLHGPLLGLRALRHGCLRRRQARRRRRLLGRRRPTGRARVLGHRSFLRRGLPRLGRGCRG